MPVNINVKNRIEFVKKLNEVRSNFQGLSGIEDIEGGSWTHTFRHFDSLRNYLLLSCFDILGQTKDYIDFDKWLTSKEKAEERNEIVRSFNSIEGSKETPQSLIEITKSIYQGYNNHYGVRKSFINFIDKVISPESKRELLESIE